MGELQRLLRSFSQDQPSTWLLFPDLPASPTEIDLRVNSNLTILLFNLEGEHEDWIEDGGSIEAAPPPFLISCQRIPVKGIWDQSQRIPVKGVWIKDRECVGRRVLPCSPKRGPV